MSLTHVSKLANPFLLQHVASGDPARSHTALLLLIGKHTELSRDFLFLQAQGGTGGTANVFLVSFDELPLVREDDSGRLMVEAGTVLLSIVTVGKSILQLFQDFLLLAHHTGEGFLLSDRLIAV